MRVPSWIKNNADWWADDKIDDFTFAQGIGFLIKNKIIQINDLPTTSDGEIAIENDIAILGMIGNKINLSFVPSDNVKIVWTKIGNFEITEPFIVQFNESGRFNTIKFDYEEKSIFFETIENEGTVTFSGEIKSVLADGQNYSNFNENMLNTLEGKHNYKVTLID